MVAPPAFEDLVQAYYDCRRGKRNTRSARQFELTLEDNLLALHEDLIGGTYRPDRSICFVVTRPKPREIWAADFRDRIVHHLLYNRIGASIEATFIADSCACIPGRGTLYAARRLEKKIRSATQNWSKPVYYMKCDLANFFVSIDKRVLAEQIASKVPAGWWLDLALQILWHEPRTNYELRCPPWLLGRVPPHKRLAEQPAHRGLPIGNLSSQFFANIYLDALDQFAKHQLKCRHYIRYVDDFVILHESPQQLNAWRQQIEQLLGTLSAQLNPKKTIIQPVGRGVDFVGHVIKPWRTTARRKIVSDAIQRIEDAPDDELMVIANSYLGLLGQSPNSFRDRAKVARAALRRGRSVNAAMTKTYRGKS